ncbi:MAG: hypothetical protein M1831_002020 [Alyxoria varia]|nr:MAG: hypothetical protein M1831_002020 [Alyxoria varia]
MSEEALETFAGVTGSDRKTALAFLKGNNNDANQAVSAFFDDPNPSRYEQALGWVESQFAEDRYGGNANGEGGLRAEIVPDLEAPERKRGHGQPSFLKPLSQPDFLPSLITILDSIPGARESLLAREKICHDYGTNPRWWCGEAIEMPTTTYSEGEDFQRQYGSKRADDAVRTETQRLLAFLENTQRSYGSAEALSRLQALDSRYDKHDASMPLYARFKRAWDFACIDSPFLCSLTKAEEDEFKPKKIWSMDTEKRHVPPGPGKTLVDVVDRFMWERSATGSAGVEDRFFTSPAPVLTIAVRPGDEKISIPSKFYLDRYAIENAPMIQQMRKRQFQAREHVARVEQKLQKLEKYRSGTKSGSADQLVATVRGYFENKVDKENDGMEKEAASEALSELERMWSKIQERVEGLKREKSEVESTVARFSQFLTEDTDVVEFKPTMGYNLRGVGLIDPNRANTTTFALWSDPREWFKNWWKMKYETDGGIAKVEKQKVTEADVLAAAAAPDTHTLLVYANDEMCSRDQLRELPKELQDFVAADNAAFRAELDNTQHPHRSVEEITPPTSSSSESSAAGRAPPDDEALTAANATGFAAALKARDRAMPMADSGKKDDDDDADSMIVDMDDEEVKEQRREFEELERGLGQGGDVKMEEMREVKRDTSASVGGGGGGGDQSPGGTTKMGGMD